MIVRLECVWGTGRQAEAVEEGLNGCRLGEGGDQVHVTRAAGADAAPAGLVRLECGYITLQSYAPSFRSSDTIGYPVAMLWAISIRSKGSR